MPNFKKLAKGYEENALLALQELVHRASPYDEKSIASDAPYGKGVKSALDYVAKLGRDFGFAVDTCDGHCTELTFGEEGPLIGIYAHADVVPAAGKWKYPPFSATIEGEGADRRLLGRGASDDKGPLIAALYSCKLLKDNGLLKGYRVRFVAGGDEERGSSCLNYYFHTLHKPASDYGFTPDADFPLIYAEKGITHFTVSREIALGPVISMDGGFVKNAVCDRVLVTLKSDRGFEKYLKEKQIDADYNFISPELSTVTFRGKTAHASTPEQGKNAMLSAFAALGEYFKIDFLTKLSLALADPFGSGFGGAHESPELGKSTWSYGIVKYAEGKLSFTVDYRYGEGVDAAEAIKSFEKAVAMGATIDGEIGKPLLYDKKSPLVATLMHSYKHMTHKFFAKPLAIGGGTYAKEAPNCVAYGSAFPGHPGNIHSPDEYIYLDDFFAQIAIYADAIYSLGQLKK